MSICDSGMKNKVLAKEMVVKIDKKHPLIILANFISWEDLFNLALSDLQSSTKQKKWWLGRRLKVRLHLSVFILQKMFNKTDRQMEYDLKDNAAYQIFCGKEIVKNWHAPDHTKIEEFRSRLSPETQRQIANSISQAAVKAGFADPAHCDIDSTIQEANITYPTDAKLFLKLAVLSKKISDYIEEKITDFFQKSKIQGVFVDLKKIKGIYKDYLFNARKDNKDTRRAKLKSLFQAVAGPICTANTRCKQLKRWGPKLPWNIERTVNQIMDVGMVCFDTLGRKLYFDEKKETRLSLHAQEVAWFNKGKLHKKYEFGRAYQLIRLKGNFVVVLACNTIRMEDKKSIKTLITEHKDLFPENPLESATADKGYYSSSNEDLLLESGVKEVGITRPVNIKKEKLHDEKTIEKLQNRRSGIEPLIGHIKHGGQMGRSRMKSDRTTLSAGYASVLGFNLRQVVRCQKKQAAV